MVNFFDVKDRRIWYILGGLLALFVLVALARSLAGGPRLRPGPPSPSNKEPGSNKDTQKLKVMGFYSESQEKPGEDVQQNLRNHADIINYLSPFWYGVKPDGSLDDKSRDKDFWFVRGKIKLVPLVNNYKGNDDFMRSPATRRTAIDNLIRLADERGYDGYKMDFQLIPAEVRDLQTVFIKELHARLKAKGKFLAVDVMPPLQIPNEPDAYDYKALAAITDFIVVMAYDRHSAESKPGPVAPYTWVDGLLNHLVNDLKVPSNKIVLGVAAYGYDWIDKGAAGATDRPAKVVHDMLRRMKITPEWDDKEKANHFRYTDENGRKHEIWFEDQKTLPFKIALAKKYKLFGVALWRMGYEEDVWWQTLRSELARY